MTLTIFWLSKFSDEVNFVIFTYFSKAKNEFESLKDHIVNFVCLSPIYTTYVTDMFQNITPYFSFLVVLSNPLIFQNVM